MINYQFHTLQWLTNKRKLKAFLFYKAAKKKWNDFPTSFSFTAKNLNAFIGVHSALNIAGVKLQNMLKKNKPIKKNFIKPIKTKFNFVYSE